MSNRRDFIAGLGAAIASLPPLTGRAQSRDDAATFDDFSRGLVAVHWQLRNGVASILAAVSDGGDGASADARIAAYTERLSTHHRAEDVFIFPALRAAGRCRSSDVAFLDARDREHTDVHRLCVELRDLGLARSRGAVAARAWRADVLRLAGELRSLTAPHFDIEEATLTVDHLRTLITEAELRAMFRDMHENWNTR
jgi:hypothetical protein